MSFPERWEPRTLAGSSPRLEALERPGNGSPVVFLHGAGANALAWTPIVEAFGDRPLLLVDMPGHGQSPVPTTWELVATAESIFAGVNAHFPTAPILWVGHSWGGKIAGILAAQRRSRTEGLLLLDPSPSGAVPIDIQQFVDGIWKEELTPRDDEVSAIQAALQQPHWAPGDDLAASAIARGISNENKLGWSLRPGRDLLIDLATATLHHTADEILAKSAGIPTLLLVAEESLPWQQITNMALYSWAKQVVVPGNHWIHRAESLRVCSEIRAWLHDLRA